MTTAIHLCGEAEAPKLAELVSRARAEAGGDMAPDELAPLLAPLLDGAAQVVAWIFGPGKAPTGYVILSFRYSLAQGGTMALVEDIYVRPAIRNRGIATEVLLALAASLRDGGVVAMGMELGPEAGEAAPRLAAHAGLTSDSTVTRAIRRL